MVGQCKQCAKGKCALHKFPFGSNEHRQSSTSMGCYLSWSMNPPTKTGWYWYNNRGEIGVCRVTEFHITEDTFQSTTEWAGPIDEPKER